MFERIKEWNKKNKDRYDMSSFTNKEAQPAPKAHDNINDVIIANTLQEIAHSSGVFGGNVVYKGQTKGGEDRYLNRWSTSRADEDLRKIYYQSLMQEAKMNPAILDTIPREEALQMIQDMQKEEGPTYLARLVDMIKNKFGY